MLAETQAADRVVQDARLLLKTVSGEVSAGRKPYNSDVRRLVERQLALRYAEYVQFLERYGFLTLDRRQDLLSVTRAGESLAYGDEGKMSAASADAKHHFGKRLAEVPASQSTVQTRLGTRYLLEGAIGRGGFGSVWRGQHLSLDRPVAIKLFDGLFDLFPPDRHAAILRRLELAVREQAGLVSPFVVQTIDQDVQNEPPYAVMELVGGGNLRALLDSTRLTPGVALRYFIQAALGLKAGHDAGVMHRDLKPENILLDLQGNLRLSDFGLIQVAEPEGRTGRQAYVGYGSVGYMAPERLRGVRDPEPSADLYALGMVLYEMLCGHLPGRRSPLPSLVVEGVPEGLDDLFDQLTDDDPARRPQSVDEVLAAIWDNADVAALLDAQGATLYIHRPVPMPESAPDPVPVPAPEAAPEPEPIPASAPTPVPEPPTDGVERVWSDDGDLVSEREYVAGELHGPATEAVPADTYADPRIVRASGRYERGLGVGKWTFVDREGEIVDDVDYGEPLRTAETDALTNEHRSADGWRETAAKLLDGSRRGEALVAWARAAAASADAGPLRDALGTRVVRAGDAAQALTLSAASDNPPASLVNALLHGADAAGVLRALAEWLDQDGSGYASLDLIDAALLVAPARTEYADVRQHILARHHTSS